MPQISSEELTPSAAPTRYVSPSRAARQAARIAHRTEVAAGLKSGFGRRERRHSQPTPNLPDKDKEENAVWVDIVRTGKRATQFQLKCLDCGPFGEAPSRKQALNSCGTHLQQKHPGVVGRVRRDVV